MVQSAVAHRKMFMLPQAFAHLARYFIGALDNLIERTELLNPLSGSLWSHPWNSNQVV